jgi:RsiW-degrading membrane proteinase PrsW (M82 family)
MICTANDGLSISNTAKNMNSLLGLVGLVLFIALVVLKYNYYKKRLLSSNMKLVEI